MDFFKPLRWLLPLAALVALLGCVTAPAGKNGAKSEGFRAEDIAKADIDMVAEVSVRQSMDYLQALARKLYLRNPAYWRGRVATVDEALDRLFGARRASDLVELRGLAGANAIHLAFDDGFAGDRVAAFIEGIRSMTLEAYGGKTQFFMYDRFDPQKIYHLARNLEIAFWKLGHDTGANGQLYLVSNATEGDILNLSFERLYGKLISLHDHFAVVVADSTNRQIKNVIQGVASMIFLPI